MFKKLILMVLAISSNYGMESMESKKESLENNIIKQNTEDVKDNIGDIPKTVIFQDDEKAFLYSDDNIDITDNIANKTQSSKTNEQWFHDFVGKLFIKYPDNTKPNEKLFDLQHLPSARQFKHMNDDEKDWARFVAYNQFAETCQSFLQMAILKREVSQKLRRVLYLTHSLRNCIIAGLDPQQIFLDELKFNVNSECYTKHLPHLQQQFNLVVSHLKPIREKFHKYFIEHGIVEEK